MKYEERKILLEEYQLLPKSVGWWETDPAATMQALQESLYSVVVLADNKAVDTGRVIGDSGLYYYIQDIMVDPVYQLKGIGSKIISMLMEYVGKNAKPGAFIALMAANGLEAYYTQFGFQPRPTERPGMYYIKQ